MFNLFLFLTAGLANGLWSCLIFGRLIGPDYVCDFSPFWPITQGTLDARFGDEIGRLFGISLWQLQALWLLFAVSTWVSTLALYWFTADFVVRLSSRNAPNLQWSELRKCSRAS